MQAAWQSQADAASAGGCDSRGPTRTARFRPPAPAELARLFPQLEILELLGQGGMGAVYKARQPALDRLVAVKILPPEIGADAAFAERFSREARALARLSHQNIVSVFDFGQVAGQYYFIMEFVDGQNLRQLIAAGALQPAQALAIVPQICEALQYAHDQGIVHRDIKPENLLMDRQGRVKIADFGLAKLLGQPPAEVTLTQAHQVMGTPHYMAPEQMRGAAAVDHRADIYSLGVVFYEMLTGELPLGRFAPPSRKVQVDVRLDEVVLKTLEHEPGRRYQHASDVKSAVHEASTAVDDRPPQYGPEHRAAAASTLEASHPLAAALAVAGVMTLLSALAYFVVIYRKIIPLDASLAQIPRNNVLEVTLALAQLATVPAALLAFLGAASLRQGRSPQIAQLGAIAMLMPLTPGWLITMPLAIWVLLALKLKT